MKLLNFDFSESSHFLFKFFGDRTVQRFVRRTRAAPRFGRGFSDVIGLFGYYVKLQPLPLESKIRQHRTSADDVLSRRRGYLY